MAPIEDEEDARSRFASSFASHGKANTEPLLREPPAREAHKHMSLAANVQFRKMKTLKEFAGRVREGKLWRQYGRWLLALFVVVFGGIILLRVVSPYLGILPAHVRVPGLGWVRGVTYPMARVFKGIPFGKAARFEPPEPAAPWDPEVLDASKNRPACMHPSGTYRETVAEDCLHLNIYAPTWGVGRTLNPVLVWFHGGGYTLGAGSDTTAEDASELVLTHMMVVVTTNYRLGAFGFLGGEHLRSSKDNTTGNWGTQDQALALRWVQSHIVNFGGDPRRVTVIGWSAGAASISVHLAVPEERGLFQQAIMMSGGFTDWAALPMSAAQTAADDIAQCLGCPRNDRPCIEGKDAFEVLACSKSEWYGPVVDDVYLKEAPLSAVLAGSPTLDYSVPIIIGCTLEDKLLDIGRHATAEKFRSIVEANVDGPDAVEEALRLYPLEEYAADPKQYPPAWSPAYWASRQMLADRDFTCVMRSAVDQWSRQARASAYWYSWAQAQVFSRERMGVLMGSSDVNDRNPAPGSCYPCPGAGHGADLAFLFENPMKIDVKRAVKHGGVLSTALQNFDTNFVWSGDPGTDGTPLEANTDRTALPQWDPYSTSRGNAMHFLAGASKQIEHYREAQCLFWQKHAKGVR